MLNLKRVNNQMRFEINKAEIEKQSLKVKSALERLGISVNSKRLVPRSSSDKSELKANTSSGSEHLSDDEYEDLFIQLQKDLKDEKSKNIAKDEEIHQLQDAVVELESSILLKEAELALIDSSVTQKEKEYEQNKLLAEQSKAELAATNEKLAVTQHILSNQRIISYATMIALIIIGALGFFAYKNFRKQKAQALIISKQKENVELQKHKVEEQNREITDSINYAKRIQEAILPPLKLVKEYLHESFIIYKPKDIVAGDFYWLAVLDDYVLFAAEDCTGHGVPGAMVSVGCSNALNRAVREHKLSTPSEILDKTLETVVGRFNRSDQGVRDGMDIALCSLNTKTMELQFAGAHNPLWIIRKGGEAIEELKGDKQPVGKYAKHQPFHNNKVKLKKGDTIYMFSDGYIDQFGGELGKKYKSKNFQSLLLSIADKSLDEQKVLIEEEFHNWKGSEEQLDDVCVIGYRA